MTLSTMNHMYLLVAAGGACTYVLWRIVYLLFLHPLAKVPGPLLARLSTWHECYYDLQGRLPWALVAMHEKYGPVVRATPDEIHIADPDYLDTIYAMRNRNSPFLDGLLFDQSMVGNEDFHVHKMRRDALNPAFSPKAIANLDYLFLEKRDALVQILNASLTEATELNLSDAFFAFSNDVVRSFSFGSDNGLLGDLREAKKQRENLARLLTGVNFNKHFPWVQRGLGSILPMLMGEKALPPAAMDMIKFRAKAGKDIEAILADVNNEKKGRHSIFYELKDSPILPPEEKSLRRLQDEATLIVMAGTESTAKSLGIATFYLLSLPSVMEELRQELTEARRTAPEGRIDLSKLSTLPYLNAVIIEANRLSFGVTRRLLRYSPNETLEYTATSGPNKGTVHVFPPRTILSSSTLCIHTDESLYPDPWKFKPERWLTTTESVSGSSANEVYRRKRAMLALGKGHRKCLGINVANAALCVALASVVEYDWELIDTDESDIKFQHDFQISHPKLDSKGIRAVAVRKVELQHST